MKQAILIFNIKEQLVLKEPAREYESLVVDLEDIVSYGIENIKGERVSFVSIRNSHGTPIIYYIPEKEIKSIHKQITENKSQERSILPKFIVVSDDSKENVVSVEHIKGLHAMYSAFRVWKDENGVEHSKGVDPCCCTLITDNGSKIGLSVKDYTRVKEIIEHNYSTIEIKEENYGNGNI